MDGLLSRAEAAAALEDRAALMIDPFVVVDLDSEDVPGVPAMSRQAPVLLVGVSADPKRTPDIDEFDLLLTSSDDPPRPWVSMAEGLTHALAVLRERVLSHPRPSTVLAQVLRVNADADPHHGLIVESLAYSTLQAGQDFQSWLAQQARSAGRAGDDTGSPDVRVERFGAELSITLDRSDRRNAIRARTRDELLAALDLASVDGTIREVHLHGNGPSFCSGGDLREFGTFTDPSTAHTVRTLQSVASALADLSGRAVAHLHGHCIGAGIELAAFCQEVRAAADTTIRLPEVGLGLIPGAGGTVSITKRIGRHRTLWLGLSGSPVDVTIAERWGLIDVVENN